MVQTTAPPGKYGKKGCAVRRNTLSGLPRQNKRIKPTKQLDTCTSHDSQDTLGCCSEALRLLIETEQLESFGLHHVTLSKDD